MPFVIVERCIGAYDIYLKYNACKVAIIVHYHFYWLKINLFIYLNLLKFKIEKAMSLVASSKIFWYTIVSNV